MKTYSALLCKLLTSFLPFSILILSGKNGKSVWSWCNFSGYWTSTSRKYPSSLSSLYFSMKSLLNWNVSSIYSKLFNRSFCNIARPYKLTTSQYLRYDGSLFLWKPFMHFLLALAYQWIAWYIFPLLPF